MTDQTPARVPRRPVRRPGPAGVIWGSVALFAVLFAFLTSQLASGNDPSLSSQAVAKAAPRKVLVRRVIRRRVVTRVVPAPGPTSVSSGPVSTSSAPVVSAPAPAPVTTSAS